MQSFNLDTSAEGLIGFINYRKCRGLLLAYLYDLPIVKNGIVVDALLSEEDMERLEREIGSIFLCRPDSPIKQWSKLPRGKDLEINKINSFYQKCLEANNRAILLCFKHPSIYYTGKIVERYRISGGLNILVDWLKKISIEYVGPGFDVGELTRGCNNYHCLIEIPWEMVLYPPTYIWNNCILKSISARKYENSRKSRIDTLVNKMNYDRIEVEHYIPEEINLLNEEVFCNAFYECIIKIIRNLEYFDVNTPIVILANLYGTKLHAIEVWESNT